MLVLLDTNILISALISRRPSTSSSPTTKHFLALDIAKPQILTARGFLDTYAETSDAD